MNFVNTHGRSPCHVLLGRTAPHLQAYRPLLPYCSDLCTIIPSVAVCASVRSRLRTMPRAYAVNCAGTRHAAQPPAAPAHPATFSVDDADYEII